MFCPRAPESLPASVWIHVGLPKTGSTTLQEDVFPALGGLAYLGYKGSRLTAPYDGEVRRLVDAIKLAPDRPEVAERCRDLVAARWRLWNPQHLPALISEEGFSTTRTGRAFDGLALMPEVLGSAFGRTANIAVVVRDPLDLLASVYEQRLWTVPTEQVRALYPGAAPPGLDAYVAGEARRFAAGAPDTVFGDLLRFDRVVAAYAGVFGEARVHVLPFEPLRDEPARATVAWCRLLGLPDQTPPLAARNRSSAARRRAILARFGAPADDAAAAAFEARHAEARRALADRADLAEMIRRHCGPVRARAEATYAALLRAA